MDHQRIFLYGALGLLLLVIWQTWQVDYGAPRTAGAEETTQQPDASGNDNEPAADLPDAPIEEPAAGDADTAAAGVDDTPAAADVPSTAGGLARGERIRVRTDLLDVTIDTRGGDIRAARLLQHRESLDSERPIELLSDEPQRLFVAQSGLQAGDRAAPTHHSDWQASATEYRLGDRRDELRVPLTWRGDGVEVTKTYTFSRDSYLVEVAYEVENTAEEPWDGRQYRQLQRVPRASDESSFFIRTYTGAAYYSPEDKYTQVPFDEIDEEQLQRRIEDGWAAMLDHYFLASWIPPRGEPHTFYTRTLDRGGQHRYMIGLYSGTERVEPGASGRFSSRLYIGAKEQSRLTAAAEGLNLTVNYGYMTILSRPLFWVLEHIHAFVGNWGLAIILLTLLIKIVFYKLSEKSFRSMAHMRRAQPKMQQIKDRYGDDREKMGRAMMDLYKKEKINPLGGCLPILVQIPVFIALFWMLLGSVELRHAPLFLWIQDLSSRDPFFVLPLLMGISMWAQQKLNPAPVDPIQQKIFTALPFVFTVFFAFFPAGLVLYWLTNNILSIAQQYYITHYVVGDAGKPQASTNIDDLEPDETTAESPSGDAPKALTADANPGADDADTQAEKPAAAADNRDVRDKKSRRKGQRKK